MLAVLLVFTQITIFSVTLYLHRSQAHRGVDFHPALAHVFRFWLWLTTSMITREWVAIHRKHHAKVETEDDPHSPVTRGIGRVFWHGVELYREARGMRADIEQYGRGTPDDAIERHLIPHPTLGPVLLLVINSVLFGLPGVACGRSRWHGSRSGRPAWSTAWATGGATATASLPIPPPISRRGSFWIGGEELHNNHHAFPSSARFAMRRWEFDIGWSAIRLLQTLRLAKVLRVAPAMDVRPNIAVPDAETLKALLSHRFQAMTDYQRNVFMPALREEAAQAGAKLRRLLPRRLRRGLVNDGRWLKPDSRAQLSAWVAQRPRIRTLVEYRARLAALLEARGHDAAERLHQLQAWCREAEESGIAALQAYAARLKGYSLVGA
jgi:stearoyl-CoA desaturase (delta-9 desaturase)